MLFVTVLIVTLLGLFAGGRCEIGQHDNWVDRDCDCDKLYEAFARCRDDVVLNQAMISAYSWRIQWFGDRYKNYAGVNWYNDRDLRRFACAISDSNNSSDVAELLNVPEDDLVMYVFWKSTDASVGNLVAHQEFRQSQLPILAEWITKSGYPDTWPPNVTYNETMQMLNNLTRFGKPLLNFNKWAYKRTNEELAGNYSDPTSTSLEKYFENLSMWSFNATIRHVDENLKYGRWIRDHGYQDYWKAYEAMKQLWLTQREAHYLRFWA